MELNELHVHQRDPGAIGDRGPVGGRGVAVGRFAVDAAEAAGREDRRLRGHEFELAVADVVGDDPRPDAVFDGQSRGEVFFVDLDAEALQLLPKGVQDDEPRDVGRVACAGRTGAAERPLSDAPVGHAGEDAAAMLEPDDLARCVLGHRLDRVLVAQIVRALGAVEGVVFRRVVLTIAKRGVDPALSRAGVAAHRMHLRDDRDVGTEFGCFDGCAHPGETAPDHDDVVLDHVLLFCPRGGGIRSKLIRKMFAGEAPSSHAVALDLPSGGSERRAAARTSSAGMGFTLTGLRSGSPVTGELPIPFRPVKVAVR